jgi:hypothetical protein
LSCLPQEMPAVALNHSLHRRVSPGLVYFLYMQGTERIRMQTTWKECSNSAAAAEHICRLLIAQLAEGKTKEEVTKFRSEMYALCPEVDAAPAAEGAEQENKKEKKEKKAKKQKTEGGETGDLAALKEKLQSDGRLETAVQVKGRGEQRKNASINGVYAEIKAGFEGKRAWEKVDGSTARVLFYSNRKGRWKINATLDDSQGGFAFAKTKASDTPLGDALSWQVFDGSSAGYNEDLSVKCALMFSGAATNNNGNQEATKEATKEEAKEGAGSGSDDDGSDAEANSSSDSSEESGGGEVAAPASPVKVEKQVTRIRGRACAKMLVRTGLRCPVSFALRT